MLRPLNTGLVQPKRERGTATFFPISYRETHNLELLWSKQTFLGSNCPIPVSPFKNDVKLLRI